MVLATIHGPNTYAQALGTEAELLPVICMPGPWPGEAGTIWSDLHSLQTPTVSFWAGAERLKAMKGR